MRGTDRKEPWTLGKEEVQIHTLRMDWDLFPNPDDGFLYLLQREEMGRYLEFELRERRREFLWSHLLVRRVLASVLGRSMEDLDFGYESNGKPFLSDSDLQWNLSHTEGLAACSISYQRVGIDVEKMNPEKEPARDWKLLARRFFSEDEKKYLFSRPSPDQKRIFYELFTLKEAAAKADGKGWGRSFGRPSPPLAPAGKSSTGSWEYLREFLEPGGYYLAHAAEKGNQPARYRFFEWTEATLRKLLTPRSPALTEGVYGHLHG